MVTFVYSFQILLKNREIWMRKDSWKG